MNQNFFFRRHKTVICRKLVKESGRERLRFFLSFQVRKAISYQEQSR